MRVDDHMRVRREARAMTVGEPAIVSVRAGTTEVLLTRLPSGRVVAFTTHCPHQGTPLTKATIYEGTLRCPQHTYLYDLTTGANIFPTCDARPEAIYRLKPGYLKIYEVEERDGWIWVSDTPKPPPSEDQPSGEAPAVFRVTPRPATTTPAKPPQAVVHPVEEVFLRLDEEFELEIPTTPVPGHMWRLELSSDRVRIVGQQYDPAGQPLTRVRAVGQEAGRVTLRCLYARPWGQSVREIRTYQIEVTH
jgi:nitrite reductase/ring-hydroxylating ferredoxin subunit/predicted secreted protein